MRIPASVTGPLRPVFSACLFEFDFLLNKIFGHFCSNWIQLVNSTSSHPFPIPGSAAQTLANQGFASQPQSEKLHAALEAAWAYLDFWCLKYLRKKRWAWFNAFASCLQTFSKVDLWWFVYRQELPHSIVSDRTLTLTAGWQLQKQLLGWHRTTFPRRSGIVWMSLKKCDNIAARGFAFSGFSKSRSANYTDCTGPPNE